MCVFVCLLPADNSFLYRLLQWLKAYWSPLLRVSAFIMVAFNRRVSFGKYDWILMVTIVGVPVTVGVVMVSLGLARPFWILVIPYGCRIGCFNVLINVEELKTRARKQFLWFWVHCAKIVEIQ